MPLARRSAGLGQDVFRDLAIPGPAASPHNISHNENNCLFCQACCSGISFSFSFIEKREAELLQLPSCDQSAAVTRSCGQNLFALVGARPHGTARFFRAGNRPVCSATALQTVSAYGVMPLCGRSSALPKLQSIYNLTWDRHQPDKSDGLAQKGWVANGLEAASKAVGPFLGACKHLSSN